MTKFSDQLFTDLMREYEPVLRHIQRPADRGLAASRLTGGWLAGIGKPGAPGRPGRLVMAGGLCLTLAAGLVVAQAISFGSGPPASVASAAEDLGKRAAVAAADQRAYPPGQWYYQQERFAQAKLPYGKPRNGRNAIPRPCDTTALTSGTTSFWTRNDLGPTFSVDDVWLCGGQHLTMEYGLVGGSITTADLSRLPVTPQALIRYLAGLGQGAYFLPLVSGPEDDLTFVFGTAGTDSQRAFVAVAQILDLYLPSPSRVAELYLALGELPGVTVDTKATDIAGRHGVAFTMSLQSHVRLQIVLNSRNYRFMGYSVQGIPGEAGVFGNALLRRVPVSAPKLQFYNLVTRDIFATRKLGIG